MKRVPMLAVAGILAAVGGTAMATDGSLTQFTPKVMPVLVHVNSHGKVTSVSPSTALPPQLAHVLDSTLKGWISKPAVIDGRAVDTDMVVNVALQASPRDDGQYDARFAYVSSSPTPYKSSHWVSKDGYELGLADNSGGYGSGRYTPNPQSQAHFDGGSHVVSQASSQNAVQSQASSSGVSRGK
jgi:hypothetical protein